MKKYLYTFLLLFFAGTTVFAQQISGQLLNNENKKPIPFATIQSNTYTGVITNDEGKFTVSVAHTDTLIISCLGYVSKKVKVSDLKENDNIIMLEVAVNQLDEVIVKNTRLTVDSIMANVRRNQKENYTTTLVKHKVFFRNTSYMNFENLDFNVKKVSGTKKVALKSVNEELDALLHEVKNSKTIHFMDYLADYYAIAEDSAKIHIDKATQLIDHKQDFSIENIQKRSEKIILKYLDTTQTYKVKTGLFKIEDSLSLSEEMQKEQENEAKQPEFTTKNLRSYTNSSLKNIMSKMNRFINADLYEYEIEDIYEQADDMIYVIHFEPRKRKALYTGTLYVSDNTYAIIRADYNYAKGRRGEKFNLKLILGIKYIENVNSGTFIFSNENEDHTYYPKYIKETSGQYVYLKRPLKFIENSAAKDKVLFNFLLEGNSREKEELLFLNSKKTTEEAISAIKEKEKTPYQDLNYYDSKIWEEFNVIAPLEEMKQFNSIEK